MPIWTMPGQMANGATGRKGAHYKVDPDLATFDVDPAVDLPPTLLPEPDPEPAPEPVEPDPNPDPPEVVDDPPDPAPAAPKAEHVCGECNRKFGTERGLGIHTSVVHGF